MTIRIVIITEIHVTVYNYSLLNTDGSKLQLFITNVKHNWSFCGFRRPNLNFVRTNSEKSKKFRGTNSLLFNLRADRPDLQWNPCGYYVLYSSSQHLFETIFAPINVQELQLAIKSEKYRSHWVKPHLTSLRFQQNDSFLI